MDWQRIIIAQLRNKFFENLKIVGPIPSGALGEFIFDCLLKRKYVAMCACAT